jgi:hypothetical protein
MILDDLYNSEINFKIATDWDAGWTVALGNEYRASLPKRTFGLSTTRAWRRNRNRNCPRLPMSRARQGGWRRTLNSHHASQRRSSDWIVGVRRVRL